MVNEYLGRDIAYSLNDIQFGNNNDFAVVFDSNNLIQAIETKLKTTLGEYVNNLFGSELNTIKGSPRNENTLLLTKKYVQFALKQEPRIQEIIDVTCVYDLNYNNKIDINIVVLPIKSETQLNLIFPMFI